ncbi:hypothetical protein [secondary endosymbiont of Trabutina mannipara]|nr:hypothetical protein [secondary endosymbiont of Trabutina mannipara]
MFDGEPCSIIDNQFVNPGKGQALFSLLKITIYYGILL